MRALFLLRMVFTLLVINIITHANDSPDQPFRIDHPLNQQLLDELLKCKGEENECTKVASTIVSYSAKIANEYSVLLLYDRAKGLFEDILYYVEKESVIGKSICHILSTLTFSQGEIRQVSINLISPVK